MLQCIKYTVVVFNAIFLLAGIGTIALGIYVRVDNATFDAIIGEGLLPIAAYVLIGGGAVIVLISLAGCYGALKQNRALLGIYFACLLVAFLAEVAAGILGFLYYDQVLYYTNLYIGGAIRDKYGDSNYRLVTDAVDMMHREFRCCGYVSPSDWMSSTHFNNTNMAVPISCCLDQNVPGCNSVVDPTKTFTQGCHLSLIAWLQTNLQSVGAVAISVAVFQLIGMAFSLVLCKKAEDDEFV